MIDENGRDKPAYGSGNNPSVLRSLARSVPGAAPNAPKRNFLVALAYLFACLLAVGLLRTVL